MKRNETNKREMHASEGRGGGRPGALFCGRRRERVCEGCSGRRDLKFVFGPFGVPKPDTQRESAPADGASLNQKIRI